MTSKKMSAQEALVKTVDQLNKSLDAAESQLGPDAPALTPDAKRRRSRTRKGGERVLQMIAELVQAHNLDSSSLSSTEMLAKQERATTFASALARLQRVEKRVSDEQFVAQGDAWSMGLQFYALLQRRAVSDGTLASSLGPITSFFNYRHDSTKPTKLQTRANAKLRDAQKLVARAKPRASVLEDQYEDAHAASAPTTTVSAPAATAAPAPVTHASTPTPAPVVSTPTATPSVIVPAPAGSNGAANGSNGYVNGSNGYVTGASNAHRACEMSHAVRGRQAKVACRPQRDEDASDHGAIVAAPHGIERSPRWPEVAHAHLKVQPKCAACLKIGARVEVHHVVPFHICIALGRPALELDERNLITLCAESDASGEGNHHLLLGHFDDWASMNVRVRTQAAGEFHGWLATRISASTAWRELAARRPLRLEKMDARARRVFRAWMDKHFPTSR